MVHITGQKGALFDDTPRGIMEALLVLGGLTVALSVAPTLIMALAGAGYVLKSNDRNRRRKIQHSFSYLKGKKYISVRKTKKEFHITLSPEGQAHITRYLQQRMLREGLLQKKTQWDGKWRIILFDIPTHNRVKRNAFRGLIRRLGAVMLQKSVWVYPFDCSEQIVLLQDVFKFSTEELRLVEAASIGDDKNLRNHFKL